MALAQAVAVRYDLAPVGDLIDLRSIVEVRLGDRVLSLSGSPQDALRKDLTNELCAPSPILSAIDKICMGGASGEDCTSIASTDWTKDAIDEGYPGTTQVMSTTKVITATKSQTITYFALYSGTKLYFRHDLDATQQFSVSSGQSVSISVEIRIRGTHSPSVAGGLPSVSVNATGLWYLIREILAGARPAGTTIGLEGVGWFAGTTGLLGSQLTLSYDSTTLRCTASHDFKNFTASGNLDNIRVDCLNFSGCIRYTLSSPLPVTTYDRAKYSITIGA